MKGFRRRTFRTKKIRRGLPGHFIYGMIAIAIVSALMYGVWYITHLPYFTITSIEVAGGKTVAPHLIREAAERALVGNYFFLVPKRFTYLYPEKRVLESVLSVPRVSEAEVTRTRKDTILITFDEYLPHALWCAESNETQCVFLSREGFAFANAPTLSGSAFTRYTTEGRQPTTGTQLLDAERMRVIEAFIEALYNELSFRVHEVTITKDDDLAYALTGGGSIFVAGDMSVQETFDNLHSVLESEEFQHLTPGAFEYIDLRFGTRVFVKEEPTAPTAQEDATSTTSLPETE